MSTNDGESPHIWGETQARRSIVGGTKSTPDILMNPFSLPKDASLVSEQRTSTYSHRSSPHQGQSHATSADPHRQTSPSGSQRRQARRPPQQASEKMSLDHAETANVEHPANFMTMDDSAALETDTIPTEIDLATLHLPSAAPVAILSPFASDEKGRRLRNYELHRGRNRFYAKGRAITSGDSPAPFIASLFIAILLPILFFVFEGHWLWSGLRGGQAAATVVAYLVCIMWSSMLRTAWRDPGIIPRNLHRPDVEVIACHPGAPEDIGGGKAEEPRARYIRVKHDTVISKWCETCKTYRPPRTSHCRLCDNCVERTDHHCTFLNNCIGRRNYSSFLAFLVAAVLSISLVLGLSIAFLATQRPVLTEWHRIGALVLIILTISVGVPIAGLLAYHMRLVWSGRTTIEMIRPKGTADVTNLFGHQSRWQNVISALGRPMTASSALRARKWAVEREPR